MSNGEEDKERCTLLGGIFAATVQVFLGVVAIGALVYKRGLEDPQNRRFFDTWMMDVSKQGLSNLFIHFANIGLSILFAKLALQSGADVHGDECAFYFISNVLDTFCGIFFVWSMLRAVRSLADRYKMISIRDQGYYGVPPSKTWYIHQLLVFVGIVVLGKLIVGVVMFSNKLTVSSIGNALFEPILEFFGPKYELIIVMIVAPCLLNIIQCWIQDNFLDGSTVSRKDYDLIDQSDTLEEYGVAFGKNLK